jgi:hypothetical protein
MERNHRIWSEIKLRRARYLSPFTEVAAKGREAFHRERERSESKLRLPGLEEICRMESRDLLVGSERGTMAGEPRK